MHSNTENLVCKPSTFTPSRCCGRPLLMRSFQTAKRKSKHASRLHLFHEFQDICRHRELSHINLYVDRDVENSFLLILRGLAKKREATKRREEVNAKKFLSPSILAQPISLGRKCPTLYDGSSARPSSSLFVAE